MKTGAFLVLMLTLAGAAGAASVQSPGLSAEFEDGTLIGLRNRLTGESYFAPSEGATLTAVTLDPGALAVTGPVRTRALAGGREWVADTEGDPPARLTTTVAADPETGALTITQQVRRAEGGIGGVEWGLRGLDLQAARLVIPAAGGVVVDPRGTERELDYEWPGAWQAAALFVQGERGGFWLWTDDPALHFKRLRYRREGRTAALRFVTETDGPASAHQSFTSVTWRLAAYQGDWRGPAARYRALMERAYRLTPLAGRRPEWARDIRFVLRVGRTLDLRDLERLARDLPAARTLLYLPDWRTYGYDVHYPDYAARPEMAAWVKAAREMGFHVMAHLNFAGVNPAHPLRPDYDDLLLRYRSTGDLAGWYLDRPHDPTHQIVVLNVAYPRARRLLVERMAQAQREVGFDAIHLDYPVLINSTQGRVNGLNALGGAAAYLRELQAAMPEVAIGTEGIHEVLLGCSFAQVGEIFWNENERMGAYHPVRSYLFSPFVHLYGHLGMPEPSTALPAYVDAAIVGLRLASLPTLPVHGDHIEWQSEGVDLALDLAGLWAHHDLQPDFDLAPAEAMAWRGPDGFRAVLRREPEGWALRAPGHEPVFLAATGVNALPASWVVSEWPAHDEQGAFALDPRRQYLARPADGDRAPAALARPEQPLVLETFYRGARRTVAQVRRWTATIWRAADAMGDARRLMLVEGDLLPQAGGGSFIVHAAPCGGEQRTGIFAHPPWQGDAAGAATVGEFTVALPDAEWLALRFATGLADVVHDPALRSAGDGATFMVTVNGERVFSRHQARNGGWQEAEADLTRFAGTTITLRLITTPGPAGDTSYDWAHWSDARIESGDGGGGLAFDLISAAAAAATIPHAVGAKTVPYHYHFEAEGRSQWAALLYDVQQVLLPARLADLPFATAAVSEGLGRDRSVFGSGSVGQTEMRGLAMRAISGHTPTRGRTHLEWGLALPEEPCRLRFHYGVRDGGESVLFLVAVNGETLWHAPVPQPRGWEEAVVDLSPWAGQTVLLGLITDSDGANICDWAHWGEPTLEAPAGE